MTSKWIPLSTVLLTLAILSPACSRQNGGDAGSSMPPQGGSDDPHNTITGASVDGATVPRPPGPPMNYQKAAITNVSELFSTNNPTAYWTRSVELSGITVQRIFADRHFILVGPDKQHALLVQMSQLYPGLKEGQKVDLTGLIDPTGVDKSQWNVSPDEQQALTQHSIYIQERSIKPAAP